MQVARFVAGMLVNGIKAGGYRGDVSTADL
jgi:hypothetical protein